MSTRFTEGDLFTFDGDAIAHGVNCAGAMGKGIAIEFKKRYPRMFKIYWDLCNKRQLQVGDCFRFNGKVQGKGWFIYNLAIKEHWADNANFLGLKTAVLDMIMHAEDYGIKSIGVPRIGAGLGNLPWKTVRAYLAIVGEATSVELVVYERWVKDA